MVSKPLPPTKKVVTVRVVRVSPQTEFLELTGKATYDPVQHSLKLEILGARTGQNRGPGLYRVEFREWHNIAQTAKEARELLDEMLKDTAKRLARHDVTLFQDTFHLSSCDVNGEGQSFVEQTCSKCTSWYCEMSNAWRPGVSV